MRHFSTVITIPYVVVTINDIDHQDKHAQKRFKIILNYFYFNSLWNCVINACRNFPTVYDLWPLKMLCWCKQQQESSRNRTKYEERNSFINQCSYNHNFRRIMDYELWRESLAFFFSRIDRKQMIATTCCHLTVQRFLFHSLSLRQSARNRFINIPNLIMFA